MKAIFETRIIDRDSVRESRIINALNLILILTDSDMKGVKGVSLCAIYSAVM